MPSKHFHQAAARANARRLGRGGSKTSLDWRLAHARALDAAEKGDVIRAVVGYALAEDVIGLARFREKYAPMMSGDADRIAFETAAQPAAASSAEFAAIAKLAASVDTLDGFLRAMKARFPDATAKAPLPPETAKGEPVHTGSLPRIIGMTRDDARRW